MRPYADAFWSPVTVCRGDVLIDPLLGEVVVESTFYQDGEWHFTTSPRQYEPA